MTVVTYFGVVAFSNQAGPRSTWQIALASDASGRSFVTMCYDQMTYGAPSAAAAGFTAAASTAFYNFPSSKSATVQLLSCGGNGGNGCYTFRVDGASVVVATSTPSQSPSRTQTPSVTPSVSLSPTQTRSLPARLDCSQYSGTGFDPCCKGLTTMYPFGPVSDATGTPNDDQLSFTQSWSGTPFRFFGVNYVSINANPNGWLCFTLADTSYTSVLFPSYTEAVSSLSRRWHVLDLVRSFSCRICMFPCCRASRHGGWT
jgi:hypothetical protein